MDVTQLEQSPYIKIALLQWRNARECHSDLMGRPFIPLFHKLTVAFSSMPFSMMLDLQLFYRSLCYNSRSHYSLLQCLRTACAILAGTHSSFVVSSFKCEGKNSCHDLIPNPRVFFPIIIQIETMWMERF